MYQEDINNLFSNYTPIQLSGDNIDYKTSDPFIDADIKPSLADTFNNNIISKQVSGPIQSILNFNIPVNTDSNLKEIKNLFKQEGIGIKVTSGYRPGAKTKKGSPSNHGEGNEENPGAIDIVPTDRNFSKLKKDIYSNPKIVKYLQSKGWGILEETTPLIMKKTGATGKHFHLGPDTLALEMFNNNLGIRTAKEGISIDELLTSGETIPNEVEPEETNNSFIEGLIHNNSNEESLYDRFKNNVKIYKNSEKKILNSPFYIRNMSTQENNKTDSIKQEINLQVSDPTKADILYKIAEKESGLNVNAKNPVSSAHGLFQFTNSTAKLYNYGDTLQSQVAAASKLYDDNLRILNSYTSKYGTRNKTLAQLMRGMWFNPSALKSYLQTGKTTFKDGQGTGLDNIFKQMA